MLDELREQADTSPYYDDDDDEKEEDAQYFRMMYESDRPFLGMTPSQRFVITLMLFIMVLILGTSILLVTEIVVPPF
jgi:hypothetical protein